ncbi:MAG: VRR-NUC domain-containing protein [Bacteroidales bacterium]|nr:VRR-NUC domain-containing protein [Bacteroidales bacterium]
MAECVKCGAYTKYNGGLCTKCYSEKNSDDIDFEESNGLTEKERNYRYGMIKGRIAETLIQELFLSLEYNVFRYGMENTIPGIMELLKGVRSDVAQEIRRMPDFVIQNPKTKDVYFVEVKFRANGEFKAKDLPKNYPYTNAYLILVSKKHIKCLTVQELLDGKEITPESKNYLGNRKEFDLDKDVIIDFCNFAIQFFESV